MDLLNQIPPEDTNVVIICSLGKWYENSFSCPIYLGDTLDSAIKVLNENLEWNEHFGKWMIPQCLRVAR